MKFQYVTIAVSDLARSKEFYSELLGFEETLSYERWIGYGLEHDAGFGIIEDTNLQYRASSDIINLSIDNLDEFWEKVRDRVPLETPLQTTPWGTRKFIVLDPDGMKIAFVQGE